MLMKQDALGNAASVIKNRRAVYVLSELEYALVKLDNANSPDCPERLERELARAEEEEEEQGI